MTTEPKTLAGQAGEGGEKGRGRGPRVFLLFVLLATVAAVVFLYLAYKGGRLVTDDAYVHATIYSIQARVPGTVLEVPAEGNQPVEAGQVLVRLDPEEPEIMVRLAESALSSARMQYKEARIGVRAAGAEEKLVEAKLSQAKKDLARIEKLWKKKTVSEDRYDRAVTQHRVLTSQMSLVGAHRTLAEARIETSLTAVETADARLADARLRLSYTEIRSPGKGIVSKKNVEPGMVVQPGFPLMAVVDLEDLWIEANYKETRFDKISPGLKADIHVYAYPGRVFKGRVESIEAGSGAAFSLFPPENATGNWVKVVQRIPVKIVLDEDAGGMDSPRLRLGMSAEVTVFPAEKTFPARLLSFLPGF